MTEITETIRANLYQCGELTEILLNSVSLVFVVLGAIVSVTRSIREKRRLPGTHPLHTYFRKMFGGWLIVALEFQLAADIVGTIISPGYEELIKLGAVALIRTFLNYFLNKELHEESAMGNIEKKDQPNN